MKGSICFLIASIVAETILLALPVTAIDVSVVNTTNVMRSIEGIHREVCVALDAASGKQVWAATLGLTRYGHDGGGRGTPDNRGGDGPRSTPTFDDGKVYVLDSDMTLVCLNAKSGEEIWKHSLIKEFSGSNIKWKNAASPLIDGDHVYVAGGGAGESLLAFDKNTGNVAWKSGDHTMTHATPIADGPVKCVEIATGKVVWEKRGFGPGNLVLAGETLVALSDAGEWVLIKATPKAYEELARAKVIDGKSWSTPVIANRHIYARSTKEGVCIALGK